MPRVFDLNTLDNLGYFFFHCDNQHVFKVNKVFIFISVQPKEHYEKVNSITVCHSAVLFLSKYESLWEQQGVIKVNHWELKGAYA